MEPFQFIRARQPQQATNVASREPAHQPVPAVRFVAGGTNLIDMMKLHVERPRTVVDINALTLDSISRTADGGISLGALARNSDVAHHPTVRSNYAVLSEALLSGASPQLRNMATTGGNLLQRTRCPYFRDTAHACNKREPGSGCSAIQGHNRMLAILGTSEHCIATNPSDQNVALTALEATVHLTGPGGDRTVPISKFYRLPEDTPHIETVLEPGELITAVTLAALPAGTRSHYLKLRDRAAYEFALASAAVVVRVVSGRIDYARVALGGVGTIPWRSHEAEAVLMGAPPDPISFRRAAEAALRHARPQSQNGFKVELTTRCLTRALTQVTRSA